MKLSKVMAKEYDSSFDIIFISHLFGGAYPFEKNYTQLYTFMQKHRIFKTSETLRTTLESSLVIAKRQMFD